MPDLPFKIVVAERFEPWAVERLRAAGEVRELSACDQATLLAAVADADALLVRTYAKVTNEVIAAAPRLRVIGRGGVGLENIDVAAARAAGIAVVHTPAAATEAVADLAVGLMLGVLRRIREADAAVREERWREVRDGAASREMGELRLGIVGMGRIGRAVARRCRHGFGMRVLYNDIADVGPLDTPAERVDRPRLYAESDIVSLHVPLTEQTRGMIGARELAQFKPGALLINTARGAVVDGAALAQALVEQHLGGAGLDVFDVEPLPTGHPLLAAPHTLLTPHIAARTIGGLHRMNEVVEEVIAVLMRGQP